MSSADSVKKERQANLELLRIVAMCGVVYLHYYNPMIGGAITFVEKGSINEFVLRVFETINICAVNVFVLISGFFLSRSSKRTIGRGLEVLLKTIIFSFAFYLLRVALNQTVLDIKSLIAALLPINWFIVLYVVLYYVSPLINIAFNALPKIGVNGLLNRKTVVFGLFFLFSIWPTAVDIVYQYTGNELQGLSTIGMYGSERGYTIVQFVLCYIIGAYLNDIVITNFKTRNLLLLWIGCVGVVLFWARINSYTGYEYCNPLIVVMAVVLFVLFTKIRINNDRMRRLILAVSKCSLSVYLLHGYFIPYISIEYHADKSILILIPHILLSIIAIVAICYLIDLFYRMLTGSIVRKISALGEYSVCEKQ